MALEKFEISKTSKKGNVRVVDLRPQLLALEHMDQPEIDDSLKGRHVPMPSVCPPGTAILRFKGQYTGAGGLSVEGMCRMLSHVSNVDITPLHSHRVRIDLGEPTPPVVDKLWLDNIVRAEAFMALERRWDPVAGVNNRGHMGGGNTEGDRIDNHRSYRVEEPPEKTSKTSKKKK